MPNRVSAAGATVDLPAGWTDRTMMTLIGPRGTTGFLANVVVTHEPLGRAKTLAEYVALQATAMKAELPGLTVLDERTQPFHGMSSVQRMHRFNAAPNMIQQLQNYVLEGGFVFVVTCSAPVQDFDGLLPAFREVINSFQVAGHAE